MTLIRCVSTQVVAVAGADQLLLVELIGAIKVLPMDTLIQTIKLVIKQPPMSFQDTKVEYYTQLTLSTETLLV